jgi:hypothetical protein
MTGRLKSQGRFARGLAHRTAESPLTAQMMVYRNAELSPSAIDRGWPYQVALPANSSLNGGYNLIHEFCKSLSLCSRGHAVVHDGEWFNVYCFADSADAEKFMARFGGEKFDPRQRGSGRSWARWRKA